MAISASYLEWVLEQLNGCGAPSVVTARRMFGGAGLYCEGQFFALIAEDVLYFREGENNRAAFDDAGSEYFQPFPDRAKAMPYRTVPESVLEDGDALREWLTIAVSAARENKAKSKKSRR